MGVEGGGSGGFILVCGENGFQLSVFVCPCTVFFVESHRQAAPAGITGKDLLFLWGSKPPLCLNLLKGLDGGKVILKLHFRATLSQMVIGDIKVLALVVRDFRVDNKGRDPGPGLWGRRGK